jgi:class 3 adenylate cyclase/tetratricopeptide (TPR) repeat protein
MSGSPREVRKTVTVLFCDLVDSTALADGDPEAFRRVQMRYFGEMRRIVERHGGTVEKFIGDEVMAVFGVPVVHEDDALRAVRAAREMRDAVDELSERLGGERLQVRIGLNTGEVVAGDPAQHHAFVAGEAVIVAKRLEQAAEAGEILIGKATYPLVEHAVKAGPLERIPIEGRRHEMGKRRVDDIDPDAPAVTRRLDAAIYGRAEELGLLRDAFERTVAERTCRRFTVLGPAGIGKSRLAAELISSLDGRATTTVGRCLSYGEGITFWPLAEALRGLGDREVLSDALAGDEHREAILELVLGVGAASASIEEAFWAVRRTFDALARQRPLVLCFEDLHWAEPALLDLIDYLVGWSRDAPILVLALARPELVEQRPHWIAPEPNADALELEPLSSAEAESLLAGLSAENVMPADLRQRIAAAAEGNPLFIEQMSAMAAEWEDDGELSIPPSIQALLGERLDRLSREERELIERASVVGRDFPISAVAALVAEAQRPGLTQQLFSLVRKGLICPDLSVPDGEDRFSFQHVLVRDAAYEAMPKERRAEFNERFAHWLEERERGHELDELIGYHFEEACRCRLDVGLRDDQTGRLAVRAADFLAAAGARALGRNDVQAALKLLRRAVALRSPEDQATAPWLDLSQALFLSGEFEPAAKLAAETASRAAASGDEAGELRARLLRARLAVQTPGEGKRPSAELLAVAERARPVFARAGDELALTEAWFATAWAELIRCRFAAMLEAVEHALEHARRAGAARWEGELPAWRGTALFYGPTPVEDVLRWYETQAAQHPIALTQQAMLEAMRGNFDEARTLAATADAAAEEFGQRLWLASGGMAVWEIETLAGDTAAAEAAVRRCCELLEELGDTAYRSTASAELALSLCAQGRLDEAEAATKTAETLSAGDDVVSQILCRQVRARLLAARGDHERAERLADEAVALADDTDMLNWQGSAHCALADVYMFAGRSAEARGHLERAVSLYERKGNVVAARRAREVLANVDAVSIATRKEDA